MKRQNDKIDPVRSKFGKIEKEEVSLSERLDYMHSYLKTHRVFSFRQMLENQKSRMQIVVTFLAMLEMMKPWRDSCKTGRNIGEIMIERTEDGMEIEKLQAAVEAILFTMGDSVELGKIAAAIEHDEETTRKIIHSLMDRCGRRKTGESV